MSSDTGNPQTPPVGLSYVQTFTHVVGEHISHPGLADIVVGYAMRRHEQLLELYRNGDWQHELEQAVEYGPGMRKVRDTILQILMSEPMVSCSGLRISRLKPIVEALRHSSALHTLDLSQNRIRDMSSLAETLRHSSALHTLDLSMNRIYHISSLADALCHNSHCSSSI